MTDLIQKLDVSKVRRFKPYPAYKPSGVEWLGDVPEHWEVKRLKHLMPRLESGVSVNASVHSGDGDSVAVLKTSCVYGDVFRHGENKKVVDEEVDSVSCPVTAPSLIISRMNTPELVGSCGFVSRDHPSLYLPDRLWIARFGKNHTSDPRYLWYFVTSKLMKELMASLATGTSGSMKNLSQENFLGVALAMPDPPEQRVIADILDRETRKLDALIAKEWALIEKLKEKRSAQISLMVTRGLPPDAARDAGLDPHPPLKPSGADWLGTVPLHWDVKQLKWAIMFQRGHDLPTDQREEGSIPLVTSSGESATHNVAVAKGPGIVTGRYGTIGEFYLVEKDYWPLNTTLYSIHLRGNEPRFLQRMLTNLSPLFLLNAVKSAVPGVDRNDIHPVTTAVPPVLEQRAIADFLDRETAKIDQMVTKVEAAIQRLLEYRIALITAAVTGKIDVRGVPV